MNAKAETQSISMGARAVGYWICTALIGFSFLSGGVVYLLRVPQVVEGVTQLGYPMHLIGPIEAIDGTPVIDINPVLGGPGDF